MDHSVIFIALTGIATLFLGLTCLGVWKIAGSLSQNPEQQTAYSGEPAAAPVPMQAVPAANVSEELIAAISAAIAEDMGTDISGIRITSVKQL